MPTFEENLAKMQKILDKYTITRKNFTNIINMANETQGKRITQPPNTEKTTALTEAHQNVH